jgi:hypothetical protein
MTQAGGSAMASPQAGAALLAGAKVVALVPATTELGTAAAMAWDFARSAASAGFRVALVDCYVDEPRLHEAAGRPNDAGVVDLFEYGVSRARVVQQQPEPNLWFLPAGTYAPDRAATMANPQWRRLAAEFAREHVLVLLFLAPDCLAAMPVRLDGIVALAPVTEAGPAQAPEIATALKAGVPLIATLTGEEGPAAQEAAGLAPGGAVPGGATPAAGGAPGAPAAATSGAAAGPIWSQAKAAYMDIMRHREEERRRLRRRVAIYAPVLLGAAAAVLLIPGPQPPPEPVPELAPPVDLVPKPAAVPPATTLSAPRAVDSLPFAVVLLSSASRATAFTSGDDLEHAGIPTLISPVRIARRVWYRIYAGPAATERSADSLLERVNRAGLGAFRSAKAVRVPLSFALRRVADSAAARGERARLRRAGIPTFVLGRADGRYQLFAGAFESRSQAAYLGGLLRSTRNPGVLGPRVGRRP